MISVALPVATNGPSTPTTSKSRFRDTVTTNNNEFFNAYKQDIDLTNRQKNFPTTVTQT